MKKKIIQGSVKNKIVSSDLQDERDKKDFNDNDGNLFSDLWDLPFPNNQARKNMFMKACIDDPILRNSHKFYEMSREE